MFLVVDIGNTRTKLGFFNTTKDQLINHWAISTLNIATEEIVQKPQAFLDVTHVLIASVVPNVEAPLLEKLFSAGLSPNIPIYWLNHETSHRNVLENNVKQLVDTSAYKTNLIGADRLLNLIGSSQLTIDTPKIIISLGTTSTLDCLSTHNQFLGGIITCGPKTFQQFTYSTALLPDVDIFTPNPPILGLSTEACIQAGLTHAYQSLLTGLIQKLATSLNWSLESTELVLTGGDALSAKQWLQNIKIYSIIIEPELTLKGGYFLLKSVINNN